MELVDYSDVQTMLMRQKLAGWCLVENLFGQVILTAFFRKFIKTQDRYIY
jgi:hypothetical protein